MYSVEVIIKIHFPYDGRNSAIYNCTDAHSAIITSL